MLVDAKKFDQLKRSVVWSLEQLSEPRSNRIKSIEQYVGSNYFKHGSKTRVPVNFIELAVGIYCRALAPRSPRVLVTANNNSLKVHAREMELAINQVPDEIGLNNTIRRIIQESVFAAGIAKVGLHSTGKVLDNDYGTVFVDVVTLDDYIVDMSAKNYDEIQYEGNDYWIDIEDAMELYSVSREELSKSKNETLNEDGSLRAESISIDTDNVVYRDRVKLRDIWLPKEGVVLTYAVSTGKKLREVVWDGPDHGPYYRLDFSEVPGNPMPLPPIALWRDLHELSNEVFRKLANQAKSQKTVLGFSGDDDEGVSMFRDAVDGDGIKYTGAEPKELKAGGVDQLLLAFYMQTRDIFSYMAGNLDVLGGLSPMSDTVGQDKLLLEASSSRMKNMSERTVEFLRDIFKAISWYEWTDPVRVREISKPVPGLGISITKEWSAETRKGDFLDYNFDIDVYSMQDDAPSDKLRKLNTILQQYIMPLMPVLQPQGVTVNHELIIDMLSRYSNMPEILDLLITNGAPAQQTGDPVKGNPMPSLKPAHTTRTYVRVNRPGVTRAGKDYALSQLLMGGNPQKDEKAGMVRGVS